MSDGTYSSVRVVIGTRNPVGVVTKSQLSWLETNHSTCSKTQSTNVVTDDGDIPDDMYLLHF